MVDVAEDNETSGESVREKFSSAVAVLERREFVASPPFPTNNIRVGQKKRFSLGIIIKFSFNKKTRTGCEKEKKAKKEGKLAVFDRRT